MQPRDQLLLELDQEVVNILQVRKLCRNNPGIVEIQIECIILKNIYVILYFWWDALGLIASVGLRLKVWTLLLIGRRHDINPNDCINNTEVFCDEQHVLESDVIRTRGDIEIFRSEECRRALTTILQVFCLKHNIQYKQGMNEVAKCIFDSSFVSQLYYSNTNLISIYCYEMQRWW